MSNSNRTTEDNSLPELTAEIELHYLTYHIVREVKLFEINPIVPFAQ